MVTPRRNDPELLNDAELFTELKCLLLYNPNETKWIASYATPIHRSLDDVLNHIALNDGHGIPGEYNTPVLRRVHEMFHVCMARDAKDQEHYLTNLDRALLRLPAFSTIVKAAYDLIYTKQSEKYPFIRPGDLEGPMLV